MPAAQDTVAAIDLGTNTVLMVTGRTRLHPPGGIEILDDAHAIVRLGQGIDAERRIHPEAIERVCKQLRHYKHRATSLGASRIHAFGTSALRDAANKQDLIATVARDPGIELVELSGKQEAQLTFEGAAFEIAVPEHYAVLDIGGGSTELAVGFHAATTVDQSMSVDVGAVRVTERFFPSLPPTARQIETAGAMISEQLSTLFPIPTGLPLVGVAGTVTTLGALDLDAQGFDAEELDGHRLTRPRVSELSLHLLSQSYTEIKTLSQVSDQRADIITAGALILLKFLNQFGIDEVVVSTKGIRYGLLQKMLAES